MHECMAFWLEIPVREFYSNFIVPYLYFSRPLCSLWLSIHFLRYFIDFIFNFNF